ncbi:MAG: hypothetical protein IJ550_02565 [Bacteroidaceae bacterium]|nr:hypothetical protein [Bacteroidaceae bacterium]
MTAMQLQLNSDLFGALQVISGDEGLMKKAVKSLKRLATMKMAKDAEENLMSSAELDRILREGDEEIAKGNLKPIAIEDLWK